MLTGDNGILKHAVNSKNSIEISEEKEVIGIALAQAARKSASDNIETDRLKTEIDRQIDKNDEDGAEVSKNNNSIIVVMPSKRMYMIDDQGNIKRVFWSEEKDENGNTIQEDGDY